MLSKDLIELIKQIRKNGSEDNRIEIKKAAGGCPKIYDTLSSFSNQSGGGIIIFGIDQDNDFDLCGVYDADDLQKNIVSMCKQMTPVVRPMCTVATIDDKVFVSAEIQEIDEEGNIQSLMTFEILCSDRDTTFTYAYKIDVNKYTVLQVTDFYYQTEGKLSSGEKLLIYANNIGNKEYTEKKRTFISFIYIETDEDE